LAISKTGGGSFNSHWSFNDNGLAQKMMTAMMMTTVTTIGATAPALLRLKAAVLTLSRMRQL
jgi:exonuclease VII large subunit